MINHSPRIIFLLPDRLLGTTHIQFHEEEPAKTVKEDESEHIDFESSLSTCWGLVPEFSQICMDAPISYINKMAYY
jgi:hypothetical protein